MGDDYLFTGLRNSSQSIANVYDYYGLRIW